MQKILVIDDEKAIRELIKLTLEANGYEVLLASDGVEGLEALPKAKPDLIILDILMPRMDGFQFYKKIKEDELTAGIPILVVTVRGAMRDSFESLGVEAFLIKPFDLETLLSEVQKILKDLTLKRKTKMALIAGSDNKKLETMRLQLEKNGYGVEVATDGLKALGRALELLPDLFIVQFDMPGMNADDMIKAINSNLQAKKISVVVYSPLKEEGEVAHSEWGRFLSSNEKKTTEKKEAPLKIVDKFDTDSFLEKIKDFL